ncbi:sigma-54 interaction domain-containing protein [Thiohalocapsa marina]|nr:sigma 54-interacting transcriptional regulator [Thiohalocapsa marina]
MPYTRTQILELFRPILSRIDLGILFADASGGLLLCNDMARQILGLDSADEPESLRNLNGLDLLGRIEQCARPDADAAAPDAGGTAASSGCRDASELELQLGGRQQEPRFIQVRSGFVDLPCDQGHLRIVMLRDITRVKYLTDVEISRAQAALLTRDQQMLALLGRIRTIAPSEASVLLQGESGTGKTTLAQSIHARSQRAGGPFVEVNCASIPASLIESELFGHVKGAFTGASQARLGRFRSADGGTLFLDEINEFPLELQPKLLRVLQSGQFEAVGSDRTTSVDVRLITASNQPLRPLVDHGLFRADLYYRIAVIPLLVPPLRERPGDVKLLAEHFIGQLSSPRGSGVPGLADDSLRLLLDYPWPGNVRELSNAVEHGVICATGGAIRAEDLPIDIRMHRSRAIDSGAGAGVGIGAGSGHGAGYGTGSAACSPPDGSDTRQREAIEEALHQSHGNRRLAAELLGVDRSTLWRRMRRLGLA